MKKDDGFFLVGIASQGIGCAINDAPGVFTRVARYTDWVQSSIGGAARLVNEERDLKVIIIAGVAGGIGFLVVLFFGLHYLKKCLARRRSKRSSEKTKLTAEYPTWDASKLASDNDRVQRMRSSEKVEVLKENGNNSQTSKKKFVSFKESKSTHSTS